MRKLILLSFALGLLLCTYSFTQAQTSYTKFTPEQLQNIIHSPKHKLQSLAGEWNRSFEGDPWHTVTLPLSEKKQGTYVYRKTFRMDAASIASYTWQLSCLGVNYRTEVRINDQYLGNHIGGTTPFSMRIPEQMLQKGENVIELMVNSELNASSTIPLRREAFGATSGGGVYREIFLVGTPHIWVSDFTMKTTFTQSLQQCRINASAMISSGDIKRLVVAADTNGTMKPLALGTTSVSIEAELTDAQTGTSIVQSAPLSIDIEANRNTAAPINMDVSAPKLWSPTTPNLYTMTIRIKKNGQTIDEYSLPLGLYEIKAATVAGKPSILLNGEPFHWKGVEYIEDKEGTGQTLSAADFERDALALKTLGANVVRMRHSNPHPYFAHLCSKYGLFIMAELPVVQAPQGILGSENIIATAQNTMREMLSASDWQPALLAWGISDGATENTPAMSLYSQRIAELVRANSKRLLYKVIPSRTSKVNPAHVDFVCLSFIDDDMEEFRQQATHIQDLVPGKPVLFSFGKVVQPTNNTGYSHPLSIEAQAKYLRDRLVYLQESSIGEGCVLWAYNDYLTDRAVLVANNPNQYIATPGLTSRSRETRLSYNVVKALFNDEKELVITAGTYQEEVPYIYTIMSIVLLILFFVLINSSRRFRENVGRALLRPYNFYADIRDQRILSNVRTVLLAFILSGTLGMMLSSLLYHLRRSYELDFVLSHLFPIDVVKGAVNMLVWMPAASTVAATLVFMLLFVGVAFIIRLGSLFVRSRIFFTDAFIISVWAALPIILLLLLTMGLYRILEMGEYTAVSFLLIAVILIWFLYRVLRGTAVIYDVWSPQIYAIGLALIAVFITIIGLIYDSNYSTFAYVQYFINTIYH